MAPAKRIAVLGGGIGGLSTAYEILCQDPQHEITIFEMGWRLGGKCASQRNERIAHRNEEHGIHVLFGCYENGFHLVRRVYDDLGADWRSVFLGQSSFTVYDRGGDEWERWDFSLPQRSGEPGDWFASHSRLPSLPELAKRLIHRVSTYIVDTGRDILPAPVLSVLEPRVRALLTSLEDAATTEHLHAVLSRLEEAFEPLDKLATLGHRLAATLRRHAEWRALAKPVRKLRVLAEIGLAAGAGLLRAVIAGKSLYDLNDTELTDWLRENALGSGLSQMAENSGALRMIYEASFAFEDGDPQRRSYAAGTAVYVMYRMLLDYRGYLSYKMRSGTAEALITPLYRALRRRNVRFAFFHRVDEIVLTSDQRNVAAVRFCVQSDPHADEYDPLMSGTDSWPDRPRYDLLVNGDVLRQSTELEPEGYDLEDPRTGAPQLREHRIVWRGAGGTGDDSFDDVVLAIPPAASRPACRALEQADAAGSRWRGMYQNVKHTATQACQIWFDRTASQLGSAGGAALVGSYEWPLSNWADYSSVLPSECWTADVRSVAYLCGCLAESDELKEFDPAHWRQVIRGNAESWLVQHAQILWPLLFPGGALDWARLVDLGAKSGKERLAAQFFRANLTPSGRYVLSVKGSFKYRLAAAESGFANLFLAGDWTRNGADNGCVEATVMSARRAARAILGLTRDQLPVYGESD